MHVYKADQCALERRRKQKRITTDHEFQRASSIGEQYESVQLIEKI